MMFGWSRRFRMQRNTPCLEWDASGAPRKSSGNYLACTRPLLATPVERRQIRPTKRSAAGRPGHTEAALVVFYPAQVSYERLLKIFWENHDPTQGMRQGNDIGTQYRSAIYTGSEAQHQAAWMSRDAYQSVLTQANYGKISTEILPAAPFYYAEAYHQQYLAKNPRGYCGLGGTGVSCSVGLVVDG